ncbi:uncharacterized protein EI90DRAFT_3051223 [Cantharellus anzutake]|uniref:uncharacterized protein n=1 Tax=Cantharellus anzutake TaxID=1750568 RepID=UPI0019068B46|nr:uncharacterized protein EI90DRAFT_3051223 [Cantharellus anzutake]KAF8334143.1 hypothetical protein EI90DRAFT_3051223 [Cantharellus anzutake]
MLALSSPPPNSTSWLQPTAPPCQLLHQPLLAQHTRERMYPFSPYANNYVYDF